MDAWAVVLSVVILLGTATILGLVSERFGQGPILGALLAGILLGPSVLGVLEEGRAIDMAGELGVTLLMFTVGLEFSWRELRRLGRPSALLGTFQILGTLAAGAVVLALFGLSWAAAVVAGAMIALSSTATVLATLRDRAETDSMHARLATAVLLLQDMAVVPLVLVVAALSGGSSAGEAIVSVLTSIGAALLLAGALWVLSRRVLPKLMRATASSRDLPILLSVTTCLAAAWIAHRLAVSPGIGAFVAGLFLAGSPYATRVRADVGALRALFVTAFFTTVGMRADLHWMADHLLLVLGASLALVAGKTLLAAALGIALGFRVRVAVATGLLVSQVGEFAFVLSGVQGAPGLLGDDLMQLLVAAAVLSLLVTPWLVGVAPTAGRAVEDALRRVGLVAAHEEPANPLHRRREGHVLVLGLGPSGRGAALALQARGHDVVAVELNPKMVEQAEREGIRGLCGDAASEESLVHAGLREAAAVIVTVPELRVALEVIGTCRSLAPHVIVVARSRYHAHALHLLAAGVDMVADEEWETGGKLGDAVVALLAERTGGGAPPQSSVTVT
jgi:CPA2 family monovalent cation:H+ antiporter-2